MSGRKRQSSGLQNDRRPLHLCTPTSTYDAVHPSVSTLKQFLRSHKVSNV